tara:strand:- start:1202 stop:1567 length:366 start_codon:yes stop_codon:yes gene_type:complete
MTQDDLIRRLEDLRWSPAVEVPQALLDAAFPYQAVDRGEPRVHDLDSHRSGTIAASLLAASTLLAPILKPSASSEHWGEQLQATSRQIVDRIVAGGLLANPDQRVPASLTPDSSNTEPQDD